MGLQKLLVASNELWTCHFVEQNSEVVVAPKAV
jgi:hypothetical protein